MYELEPAARQMAALVDGVRDDQLTNATPCGEWDLAGLLGHVSGLTLAFAGAARKDMSELTDSPPDDSALPPLTGDWRAQIAAQLEDMVQAWREPGAWDGSSRVGGVTSPAEVTGGFGFNELVVHGWDVARSSGQPIDLDAASVQAAHDFAVATTPPGGIPDGPFGVPVGVAEDATTWDRLVALRGRDPAWSPPASRRS